MRTGSLLVLLAAAVACVPKEDPAAMAAREAAANDSAKATINAQVAMIAQGISSGVVDTIITFVAEDYTAMPPNGPSISGRAAFRAWIEGMYTLGSYREACTPDATEVHGPLAVTRGNCTLTFTPGPTAPRGTKPWTETSKFLWHWRKVDGRWLLAAGAWSSNTPAAP